MWIWQRTEKYLLSKSKMKSKIEIEIVSKLILFQKRHKI